MKKLIIMLCCLLPLGLWAQEIPTVTPTATYVTVNGEELEDATQTQDAPLVGRFYANPDGVGDYAARYEWKIWRDDEPDKLLVHRFEEDIEYTFVTSGSFHVQLLATFVLGQDTIMYPDESGQPEAILVSISESKLEFPNAFSPNGDGYNDVLKAKDGYQSIVQFEAAVFNRSGRKLYSWTNLAEGWDGKVNGKTIRDGVYFLVVHAKGADGRNYNIRKTISVLTGYNREGEGSTEGDE